MLGKRIMVTGICGAGKSTLSKIIGEKFGLPVVHIDKFFWSKNWTQRDNTECLQLLHNAVNKEKWVIDGNHSTTIPNRLERSDTVIWLNFNRFIALYRVLKRIFKGYGQVRDDMQMIVQNSLIGHFYGIFSGYFQIERRLQ
jgi:adenylate kinase family enzyme